jgi:hypothetical protein
LVQGFYPPHEKPGLNYYKKFFQCVKNGNIYHSHPTYSNLQYLSITNVKLDEE